ncbi:1-aminocyclopropane-1-carboxylate synthase [Pseudohyphozyma bogoriensis]|nr:1-aminocyclopropane-1-carboxylate synthase [Pseudohyphozyma bogoriensis]
MSALSVSSTTAQTTRATSAAPVLSSRGSQALIRPPLLKCALFENQFCPFENPDGLINLGVAENSLMTQWLIDYYEKKQFKLSYQDFTYGTALGGSVRLFKALNSLTTKYFNARVPVLREHVVAGSGCGSVIDLLVSCIADRGDGILVARPFYNGFAAAFECRNGVVPVGVELDGREEEGVDALERFKDALVQSEAAGVKIRAVMVCNPHNPLGFCYSKDVLLAYARFAEKYNIHLISDEIYALSCFESPDSVSPRPFTSFLSLDVQADAGCDPSRIHVIYGSSKDWSSNGLRVGALISQANPALHTAMESSCLLMKISSAADLLWSNLLLDDEALPTYISLNRARLSAAYTRATNFLKTHAIPYRPSNAGHFIFIDLRRFLEQGVEPVVAEERLAMKLAGYGVNLARGNAYSHPEPGWFRLTFALRADFFEQVLAGLTRVERALGLSPTVSVDVVRAPFQELQLAETVKPASVVMA